MGRRWRRAAPALVAVGIVACTRALPADLSAPAPSPTGPPLRVAVLVDLALPDARWRVLPAAQGVRLALAQAVTAGLVPVALEAVIHDVGGADAAQVAREVAADPTSLAVVVAPGWEPPSPVLGVLLDAGLPVASLSALGPPPPGAGPGRWVRAVAPLRVEARVAAGFLKGLPQARAGFCLAGDGGPGDEELLRLLAASLGRRVVVGPATAGPAAVEEGGLAAAVEGAGCGTVVWAGSGEGAAALRLALTAAGLRAVLLVGFDEVKAGGFLEGAGAAADGTVAVCPCADLSLSTRGGPQRFVHDYQAEFASAPGPYAVEGFDVGRLLARAVAGGARDRAATAAWLEAAPSFRGLAGRYAFGRDGELRGAAASVRFFRADGGRWLPWEG